MLEAKTTSSVLWILRIFRFTAAYPIEANGSGKVRPVRSKKYMIWSYLLAAYHCMITVFSGIRLVQSVNMSNSIGDKCLHAFFFGSYLMVVAFKLNLQINRKEMAAFLNVCFIPKEKFLESIGIDISSSTVFRTTRAERTLQMMLKPNARFALIQTIFVALSITQAKCSPRYLLSLVGDCQDIKMTYVLLLIPYEYLLWIQAWAMFIFFPVVVVIWSVESGYWLSIAEWQQMKVLKGQGKEQEFRRFMRLYKQLEILNVNFNDMLQDYFWPIEQALFMSMMPVMYLTLIKMYTVLPAFVCGFLAVPTITGTGYTFFCYKKIAAGAERSKGLLTRWKTCGEWNLKKRDVQACRQLDVKVGGFYSFNRCSNLVFTSLMVQVLWNLLIAFN